MKKLLCALLVLALAAGMLFCFPVTAEELPPIYTLSSLNEAQTVLTVELYTEGLNWTAVDVGLAFDPEVLTLTDVQTGRKIETARTRGFDFITMSAEPERANRLGYCNFVAAVGAANCRMTSYGGPMAVFRFDIKDLTRARASLGICISALTDSSGKPLLNYQTFTVNQSPVAYRTEEANLFIYGDLNKDGVSIFDAMLIMQHLVGMTELTEYQAAAARVSGGKEVSIFDAMLIMQYLVGMIETFPAQTPAA